MRGAEFAVVNTFGDIKPLLNKDITIARNALIAVMEWLHIPGTARYMILLREEGPDILKRAGDVS